MDQILIKLDESPEISTGVIPDTINTMIYSIIKTTIDAKKLRKNKRKGVPKEAILAIAELLESPEGISSGQLLGAAEYHNMSSLVTKIRIELHKTGNYTLCKRGRGKSTIYYMKNSIVGSTI